ncbi:hypothetical protein DFS34DRAFT_641075 [Phlyctochytrium arcticum]|nr:hypothetical protein DFS34DRAFT_641075 [Phlyctochytrium arcticum]
MSMDLDPPSRDAGGAGSSSAATSRNRSKKTKSKKPLAKIPKRVADLPLNFPSSSPAAKGSPSNRKNDTRALQIHRCRVVEHSPAGIVSLSVTPPSKSRKTTVACARNNGDIELWNPRGQGWFLERTIPGNPAAPVETVFWIQQHDIDPAAGEDEFDTPQEKAQYLKSLLTARPRLMTAGLDGRLTEWDPRSFRPVQILTPGGGAIWCAAPNATHTRLAIGSEDGHVRILDVCDGRLELFKLCEKAPTRIMSIAWHPNGQHIVIGGADSTIRKVDARTGQVVQRITTDTVPGEDTVVWDLKVLPDSTIVSGDSLGKVTFWDWKTGTPLRSVTAHAADVLCLAVNKAGTKVWSSGVDRKVVQMSFVELMGSDAAKESSTKRKSLGKYGNRQWVVSGEKRYHSHDVRALALLEERPHDALISGGVDTTLIVSSPLTDFPYLKQYRMPTFPHRPIIQITRSSRLMLTRFSDHVKLWELGRALPLQAAPGDLCDYQKVEHQREKLLATLKPKCAGSLIASAISENGEWIAVSDVESVKLFRLESSGDMPTRIRRVKNFPSTPVVSETGDWVVEPGTVPAAHLLAFTPDSRRLVVAGTDSIIYVVELSSQNEEATFEIVQTFDAHCGDEAVVLDSTPDVMDVDAQEETTTIAAKKNLVKGGREMIATLTISQDGQWLATGDLLNRIYLFNLDSLKLHTTLPIFSSLHTTLTFHPCSYVLIITCISNEFFLFDCDDARLSDWSRAFSHCLPNRWLQRKEVVTGVTVDTSHPSILTFYGASHICFVDLKRSIGPRDAMISVGKRKLLAHLKAGKGKVMRDTAAIPMDEEVEKLEKKLSARRRRAAIREIAKATQGLVNGKTSAAHDSALNGMTLPTASAEANTNGSSADDMDSDNILDNNGVIVIDSGSEHDEDLEPDSDDDTTLANDADETESFVTAPSTPLRSSPTDPLPIVARYPLTPASSNTSSTTPRRAGQKRTHETSTRPTSHFSSAEFSESFRMEHRYGPVMAAAYLGPDELIVVERPVLSVVQGLGVDGFYKHKYGT